MNSVASTSRRKRLGQHFLIDPQVIGDIVALINPAPQDFMVEIGPGRGAITEKLVNRVAHLHAIEIDEQLVHALRNKLHPDSIEIHHADALNFFYSSLCTENKKIRIVGNLPYSISTPLLFKLLEYASCIQDMCFMVQREVADRLTAECGTRKYGRLTVNVAMTMQVEAVFDVPPTAFSPPPEVQSSMIYMQPKQLEEPDTVTAFAFSELVRLAFGNRRKTLKNSLAGLIDETNFLETGIDANLRAQNLSPENYMRLAHNSVLHNPRTREILQRHSMNT